MPAAKASDSYAHSSSFAALTAKMMEEIKSSDPIFWPSAFWEDLIQKNINMIESEGIENFKRTVSQNYFNWFIADKDHELFRHAQVVGRRRLDWMSRLTTLVDTDRLRLTTDPDRQVVSYEQRNTYRLYVTHLWSAMAKLDRHNLRQRLREPTIGNPFRVKLGTKLLSQDLATSILECNVIADLTIGCSEPRIAELGAGYGRVAWTYASSLPGQYFIFDLPPALAIAQWYLQQTLGAERVFAFRPFDDLASVQFEMDRAKVILLTPNQMSKFPDGYFNLALTISTLPEMREDQAQFYLKEFQRLASDAIFLKQWKHWTNPNDGTNLNLDSYVLAPEWSIALDRTDPLLPLFFNRAWKRRG
jgi:putative sugar O-methyltransferase